MMLIDLWETVNPSPELIAYNKWRYSHPIKEWWRYVTAWPSELAETYFESWAEEYWRREEEQ